MGGIKKEENTTTTIIAMTDKEHRGEVYKSF